MLIPFKWEDISQVTYRIYTSRAKVFGGWILLHFERNLDSEQYQQSMIFIPDPNHEWEVKESLEV